MRLLGSLRGIVAGLLGLATTVSAQIGWEGVWNPWGWTNVTAYVTNTLYVTNGTTAYTTNTQTLAVATTTNLNLSLTNASVFIVDATTTITTNSVLTITLSNLAANTSLGGRLDIITQPSYLTETNYITQLSGDLGVYFGYDPAFTWNAAMSSYRGNFYTDYRISPNGSFYWKPQTNEFLIFTTDTSPTGNVTGVVDQFQVTGAVFKACGFYVRAADLVGLPTWTNENDYTIIHNVESRYILTSNVNFIAWRNVGDASATNPWYDINTNATSIIGYYQSNTVTGVSGFTADARTNQWSLAFSMPVWTDGGTVMALTNSEALVTNQFNLLWNRGRYEISPMHNAQEIVP